MTSPKNELCRKRSIAARVAKVALSLPLCVLLIGCGDRSGGEPPERVETKIDMPVDTSLLEAPIEADAGVLRAAMERAIPRTLWTIDQKFDACIKPQRVKVFGARFNVTPKIGCTIVGTVTRGPLKLRGQGREIVADIPIRAILSARDIGGVLKGETATGSAMAHARVAVTLGPDWGLRGAVRLSYDWRTPPGIDFLGQRITFTDRADEKLRPIVARLERELPRELAKIPLKPQIEQLWQKAFTSFVLNERNPPVWMRVTPQRLIYGGYSMQGTRLKLDMGLEALTETFVGPRPVDPPAKPLPAPGKAGRGGQLRLFVPVIADYKELEPVIARALAHRSRRPFDLPGIGPVNVRFDQVTAWGTTQGRIAVGLKLAARRAGARGEPTSGTIWIAARPVNDPGSATVRFTDLQVSGDTDGVGGDLLIMLGNRSAIAPLIADALTQNFSRDMDGLLGKVRRAIASKREADFLISARLDQVRIGRVQVLGQGLYLPVHAIGDAGIRYEPRNRQSR
jgi:hypothetical protein